jgi:hypothetical protein
MASNPYFLTMLLIDQEARHEVEQETVHVRDHSGREQFG